MSYNLIREESEFMRSNFCMFCDASRHCMIYKKEHPEEWIIGESGPTCTAYKDIINHANEEEHV